jgi:hypothetical protein
MTSTCQVFPRRFSRHLFTTPQALAGLLSPAQQSLLPLACCYVASMLPEPDPVAWQRSGPRAPWSRTPTEEPCTGGENRSATGCTASQCRRVLLPAPARRGSSRPSRDQMVFRLPNAHSIPLLLSPLPKPTAMPFLGMIVPSIRHLRASFIGQEADPALLLWARQPLRPKSESVRQTGCVADLDQQKLDHLMLLVHRAIITSYSIPFPAATSWFAFCTGTGLQRKVERQ